MTKYPLILAPVIKDYLWGGTRLKDEFGFETNNEIAAEAWMLASHKDGTNTILNGEFAGMRFDEVLKIWGYEDTFPILIKLIDAKQKLSIQVHPDNAYAMQTEGEYGKTEMWYVVDCVETATLAYGFNREVDKTEFKTRINNNTLDEVINYVPVSKGDMFFISAGTLHAIGEGILIAEIQQNSNITYRVSDYGRLGVDGKPRELHIDKAIDVTVTTPPELPYGNVGTIYKHDYGTEKILADSEFFKVSKLCLNGTRELVNVSTFVSILVFVGEMHITCGDNIIKAIKGDSIFVPNDLKVKLSGNAEIILTSC